MKNKRLKIVIVLAIAIGIVLLVVGYILFVLGESKRLQEAKMYTKPMITLQEIEDEDSTTYIGLGYSVSYLEPKTIKESDGLVYIECYGIGAEFKWFGVTLWSWWE